jgi:D-alanyl-lipoteichoic acid acyltransferase DltB (MBOAT superfamily)
MLFHTVIYAVFLPTVWLVYMLVGRVSLRAQNFVLLVASYFFYGWWDWRFLGLIALSSLVDYIVGLSLNLTSENRNRRLILLASLVVNLGILGFFKYYDFFITSLVDAAAALGIDLQAPTLRIILPVGLSFYTFQALTYTVGVYRRQVKVERDPIAFFAYVAFFPQLVAGPIERAGHMLPQFNRPRRVTADDFASGLRQITWGLFCKLVVADNCAIVANSIFDSHRHLPGSVALTGAVFFAFQIYGDFSGYSHIALGSARLFGFELMQNFATPYFSQSIPEFWRRWHISLSTWFRDFVFIPLGGSRVGTLRYAFNILLTFTISGLWHGASWTFVVWGFLNGLYYLPHIFFAKRLASSRTVQTAVRSVATIGSRVLLTFFLTVLAWIFFRAKTIHEALIMAGSVFSTSIVTNPTTFLREFGLLNPMMFAGAAIAALVALEFLQRDKRFALQVDSRPLATRWAAYAGVIGLILCFRYTGSALDFIYFQF